MRRMPAAWLAASAVCYLLVGAVSGSASIDCSSCKAADYHPATGIIACHCDISVDEFSQKHTGSMNLSSKECTATLNVSTQWNGGKREERDATVGDIFISDARFCSGGIKVRMKDVFASDAGIHFCPHLILCDEWDLNRDTEWCVTMHRKDSCLQHRSCSSCTDHGGCVWCGATSACLVQDSAQPYDLCGVCKDTSILQSIAWQCPTKASPVPKFECKSLEEVHDCMSGFCKWRSNQDICEQLKNTEVPELTDLEDPEITWGEGDTWGRPDIVVTPPPKGSVKAPAVDWGSLFGGKTASPFFHFNHSKESNETGRLSTGHPERPQAVKVMPQEVGQDKFEEHLPRAAEHLDIWMTVVALVFCCSVGLLGISMRRACIARQHTVDSHKTAPEPTLSATMSDRGDLESITDSRCELTEDIDPVSWKPNADMNEVEY